MNFATWKGNADELAKLHSSYSDFSRDTLRQTLVELNSLFLEAPGSIRTAYRLLLEPRIEASRKQQLTTMSGSLAWSLSGCGDDESIAERLGGQIRAVDMTLSSHGSRWPFEASEWLDEEEKFYVIPRMDWERHPANRQVYEKRGILKHRIVPTEINGYRVEVIANHTIALCAKANKKRSMGACLFPGLEAKPRFSQDEGQRCFIVESVSCDSADTMIDQQIEGALSEGCFVVVWPELAVPPALRRKIQESLRGAEKVRDKRPPPEVVVAGTWHEPLGGHYVNRAYIYDGYGVARTTYDKFDPYSDDCWGKENISAGESLRLLATEDALIGFAICLDFCDLASSNPFTRLDIDLMLVPSMGNDSTIEGHLSTAKAVKVNFGTRSFVVQHMTKTKKKDGRIGSILPVSKNLRVLGQKKGWKSYKWALDAEPKIK